MEKYYVFTTDNCYVFTTAPQDRTVSNLFHKDLVFSMGVLTDNCYLSNLPLKF